MVRAFQVFVVIFWLFATGWLIKTVMTPPDAGLSEIDPRRPLEAFFAWNDNTRMTVLEHGDKIGELRVTAADRDAENPAEISLSGNVFGDKYPGLKGAIFRMTQSISEDYSILGGSFLMRLPSSDMTIRAVMDEQKQTMEAELLVSGASMFKYNSAKDGKIDPNAIAMVKSNPMLSSMIEEAGGQESLDWEIHSYRGQRIFHGKPLPVYLMKLRLPQLGEDSIRFYLSEAGEPLLIETDFGIAAVSEMLQPPKKKKPQAQPLP